VPFTCIVPGSLRCTPLHHNTPVSPLKQFRQYLLLPPAHTCINTAAVGSRAVKTSAAAWTPFVIALSSLHACIYACHMSIKLLCPCHPAHHYSCSTSWITWGSRRPLDYQPGSQSITPTSLSTGVCLGDYQLVETVKVWKNARAAAEAEKGAATPTSLSTAVWLAWHSQLALTPFFINRAKCQNSVGSVCQESKLGALSDALGFSKRGKPTLHCTALYHTPLLEQGLPLLFMF